MTAPAAVRPTPNCRANSGIAGATTPKPTATEKATAASTPTSRGSPRVGLGGTSRSCQPVEPNPPPVSSVSLSLLVPVPTCLGSTQNGGSPLQASGWAAGGSGAFATGTSESETSESETSDPGTSGIRCRIGSRSQRIPFGSIHSIAPSSPRRQDQVVKVLSRWCRRQSSPAVVRVGAATGVIGPVVVGVAEPDRGPAAGETTPPVGHVQLAVQIGRGGVARPRHGGDRTGGVGDHRPPAGGGEVLPGRPGRDHAVAVELDRVLGQPGPGGQVGVEVDGGADPGPPHRGVRAPQRRGADRHQGVEPALV